MDWQPDAEDGAGDEPAPDFGLLGGQTDGSGSSGRAGSGPAGGGAPGAGSASSGPGGSSGADGTGLAGFGPGGVWESSAPSAAMAVALEAAGGAGWRCDGASQRELIGLVRAAAMVESWAAAAKLGYLREAIRGDDDGLGDSYHGDLPDQWSKSLTHDVALALAMSPISAQNLLQTAHDLGALLPGIGALLEDGTLTYSKARAVNDALELLSEADKAKAEQLIVPAVAGKTHAQVENIAHAAAVTVDPGHAERLREHAERNRARVALRRDRSGAATLSGCDLPPPETLAAHASICARAEVYRDCGAFPQVLTDQLRAMAYLDLMNQVSAEDRIAAGQPDTGLGAPSELAFPAEPEPDDPGPAPAQACGGSDCPCAECDGRCTPPADDPDDYDPDDGGPDGEGPDGDGLSGGGSNGGGPEGEGPGGDGPAGGGPVEHGPDQGRDDGPNRRGPDRPHPEREGPDHSGPPASPWAAPPSSPAPPKLIDLTIPLATLLGPARRPGDSHGFGVLDPKLCRALAALAAASPHTTACVTVTDHSGYAIGHGCLRSGRRKARLPGAPDPPLTALPARLNLTITADRLTALLASDVAPTRPPPAGSAATATASWPTTPRRAAPRAARPSGWALAPPAVRPRPGAPDDPHERGSDDDRDHRPAPEDPAWLGTWTITLPSGLQYSVPLEPVPTRHCDHRRESDAYEPNDTLRHLVQIRDYQCTFPTCSRHARESDFEHATPYDQGGRTCACNAGARSRACHQVKQSPGWRVTQPQPGWHQWTTPSGRTYTQQPHRYPD